MEHKTCKAIILNTDEVEGIVECIFSVMGVLDAGQDIVHNGAFSKTWAERGHKIRLLDSHNTESVLSALGKPLQFRELSRAELPQALLEEHPEATGAAWARVQFNMKTNAGRDAFWHVANEDVGEWSYGYDALDKDFSKITYRGEEVTCRNLRTIKQYELSPVIFGMLDATRTTSAKSSAPDSEKADPPESKPWNVFHEGDQYCVYKLDEDGNRTGESLGCHDTEEEARAQVEALYANEGKDDSSPDAFKFTGSPRNPYGTHASRGYPGGRSAWKRAWRIHLSGIRDQGPVQGTVRRVSMIAAGMKPACKLPEMSAEDVGPRAGACGKLSGDYKETPGDYGLSQWKDPSDDGLEREDIQLTCQDLEDLKRICLQEIAKRQACSEEGKSAKEGDWGEDSAPPGEGKAEQGEDASEAEEEKAGRVLAARNAQRIMDAVNLLTEALKDAGLIEEEDKASIYGMNPPIPLAYDAGKGHVIFPTGKSVYANNGFGGVPSDDLVPYGSDGAVDLKNLSANECVQLADYVIYKWLEFRNKYANDAPGNDRVAEEKEHDGPPSPTSTEAGPQAGSPAPESSDDIEGQVLDAEIEGLELELRLMEV